MELHDLRPDPGSRKKRKRVGRGISAGQGKTAGRGTKGQGARSGGGKGVYFEGGQLPLARRLPYKRGFTNTRKIYYKTINIGRLAHLEAGTQVDPEFLVGLGFIKRPSDPFVILGDGKLDVPLTVKAHRFSASAKSSIEAVGGSAEIIPLR
ncbi:MAG: 50S ribosomal protein L15 [Anaerolineae bacterium]|nr:50S ribosomal protein L15 [Anaerolineae bacterium]MCO5187335.1 50S ribosomal protein L15 [Anaerolineae bacterium]MCO5193921.1 50S ribosomal protein L15 [Anaerolineae bacterium]MCO5196248.1 50S ribosomal protein L15 [Anaerolineae bacterium]MCO5204462.1 50S ribosomal protein L15 [Anaerolineae bacterium]